MNTTEFQYAIRTAAFSLQCAALLDYFHTRHADSTGFHRLAARKMADRALAALDAINGNSDEADDDIVAYCDETAISTGNILRAYLKQRNSLHGNGE
jgi:hypothetical protein